MSDHLLDHIQSAPHPVIVHLKPIFERLPLPITRYDDPFLPFGKAIINATKDLVAGYLFDFAAYLAMAGAGVVAMERTIAYVPDNRLTILHGPFTGQDYSAMAGKGGFNVSALTVNSASDQEHYLRHAPHAAFLLADEALTGNPYIYMPQSRRMIIDTGTQTINLTVTSVSDQYLSPLEDFADCIREKVMTIT